MVVGAGARGPQGAPLPVAWCSGRPIPRQLQSEIGTQLPVGHSVPAPAERHQSRRRHARVPAAALIAAGRVVAASTGGAR